MTDETLADLLREVGLVSPIREAAMNSRPRRPMPRQMRSAFVRSGDANPGVRQQAMRQLGNEQRLRDTAFEEAETRSAYTPPRNQFAEAGMHAMETTGAPALARGIRHVGAGEPGEAIPEFLWGALGVAGMATLPMGGGTARSAVMRPQLPPRAPPEMTRIYRGIVPDPARRSALGDRWWSTSPEVASTYAPGGEGAHVALGAMDESNLRLLHIEPPRGTMFRSIPVSSLPPELRRAFPRSTETVSTHEVAAAAEAMGYEGVTFRGIRDSGYANAIDGAYPGFQTGDDGRVVALFNEGSIRSPFDSVRPSAPPARPLYHGTHSESLEGGALRPSPGGRMGPGIYLDESEEFARRGFASGPGGRVLAMEADGPFAPELQFRQAQSRAHERGLSGEAATNAAVQELQARGFTGVRSEQGEIAVWDQANVRARQAAGMQRSGPDAGDAGRGLSPQTVRLYHGTDQAFDDFQGEVWLTDSPVYASRRASGENANVRPVDFDPQHVFRVPDGTESHEWKPLIEQARREGYDAISLPSRGVEGGARNYLVFNRERIQPAFRPSASPDGGSAATGSSSPQFVERVAPAANRRRALEFNVTHELEIPALEASPYSGGHRRAVIQFQKTRKGYEIIGVSVPNAAQGQGHGIALYEELIRRADAAGLPVISDNIVTPAARNVYAALERRGYRVERNADGKPMSVRAPGSSGERPNAGDAGARRNVPSRTELNRMVADARRANPGANAEDAGAVRWVQDSAGNYHVGHALEVDHEALLARLQREGIAVPQQTKENRHLRGHFFRDESGQWRSTDMNGTDGPLPTRTNDPAPNGQNTGPPQRPPPMFPRGRNR